MNQRNTLMITMFMAFGVMLAIGLIAIPAYARNAIASERNKGQQGFAQSGGQGGGHICSAC